MTRIYTSAHINRPVAEVFDYVTMAGNWPQWHPSSLGVTGAADHSGEVGDLVYTIRNALWRLLDNLLVRPRIEAESAEALRRLKQILEPG